ACTFRTSIEEVGEPLPTLGNGRQLTPATDTSRPTSIEFRIKKVIVPCNILMWAAVVENAGFPISNSLTWPRDTHNPSLKCDINSTLSAVELTNSSSPMLPSATRKQGSKPLGQDFVTSTRSKSTVGALTFCNTTVLSIRDRHVENPD